MDKKENVINKLKELFSLIKSEKFIDAKLKDGTILRSNSDVFKEGDTVQVVSEDGTLTAPADNNYELEDGTVLTVASGKITAIATTTEESKPAPEPVQNSETFNEEALTEILNEVYSRLKKLEENSATNLKEAEKFKSEFEQFKRSPATAPTNEILFTAIKTGKENWTIRDYEKNDPKTLTKIKNETPELYNQLFNEYYKK